MTVGFQRFMSHWGVEARFGLFGITVSEDNFMYPDLTLRGFGRLFWGSKRFNFYAGIQHKELPEFVGSSSNGLQNTNFIEQLGLNLAFRFEYPMLKKWMLAFDYELFSTIDGSSSNGNSLNPKQSQRMSFELNHKLWQHVRTSLGLVLTNDQAEYGSESNVNFTDQNNFIEFSTFEFLMGIEISF
jgi:hypothetical protein